VGAEGLTSQSFVARVESGERRIDVVEFLNIAKAIGFDPKWGDYPIV